MFSRQYFWKRKEDLTRCRKPLMYIIICTFPDAHINSRNKFEVFRFVHPSLSNHYYPSIQACRSFHPSMQILPAKHADPSIQACRSFHPSMQMGIYWEEIANGYLSFIHKCPSYNQDLLGSFSIVGNFWIGNLQWKCSKQLQPGWPSIHPSPSIILSVCLSLCLSLFAPYLSPFSNTGTHALVRRSPHQNSRPCKV